MKPAPQYRQPSSPFTFPANLNPSPNFTSNSHSPLHSTSSTSLSPPDDRELRLINARKKVTPLSSLSLSLYLYQIEIH